MNLVAARRAPTRIGGIGEEDDDRLTARRSDVRGTCVIADGKSSSISQIDKAGKLGAADEVDRVGAARTDFGRERLFARSANDDGEEAGCLDQALCEQAIMLCRPALIRVARG